MNLEITPFVNGRWKQNCYIAANSDGDAIVIDPGSQADDLIQLIEAKKWRIEGILNTHGHFDHIGAVAPVQEKYQAPFYLHSADERLMQRANLFRMVFEAKDPVKIPKMTRDIASLPRDFEIGRFKLTWMATPGHTEGSVVFLLDTMLFAGDTLMKGKIGRTDLPGGNRERLVESVKSLMSLPGEIIVYGGHGPATTIAEEFAEGSKVRGLLQ